MHAVYLEKSFSLDTDAFINALRRFISHRGKPHTFFNDNGANLVGGYQELRRSLNDIDQSVIEERLKRQEIVWKFNPQHASHIDGIWERVIHIMKWVLSAICADQVLSDNVGSNAVVSEPAFLNFFARDVWRALSVLSINMKR